MKRNPWLHLNAVVTTFDSGGSSGQLRDELGVLPPGDVLRCALALARNEGEARRVLLSRLPKLFEHQRLGGHTGGNLLLSMMEQYSGDFLAAVDGLRALLGCQGRVLPVSVTRATLCAEHADGRTTRGEVEVDSWLDAGHAIRRIWLEPPAAIHPAVAEAVRGFDAVIIGPGSFFTSLMPTLLVDGVRESLQRHARPDRLRLQPADRGPGNARLHRRRRRRRGSSRPSIGRSTWSCSTTPSRRRTTIARYASEHKEPLALGALPPHLVLVEGPLWTRDIARHDRPRLSHAVWSVLSRNVLYLTPRPRPRPTATCRAR